MEDLNVDVILLIFKFILQIDCVREYGLDRTAQQRIQSQAF